MSMLLRFSSSSGSFGRLAVPLRAFRRAHPGVTCQPAATSSTSDAATAGAPTGHSIAVRTNGRGRGPAARTHAETELTTVITEIHVATCGT